MIHLSWRHHGHHDEPGLGMFQNLLEMVSSEKVHSGKLGKCFSRGPKVLNGLIMVGHLTTNSFVFGNEM